MKHSHKAGQENNGSKRAAKSRARKGIGLRGRLFAYLLLFSLIMLALLWTLQVVYLDRFYEGIKREQINATAEELIQELKAQTQLDPLSFGTKAAELSVTRQLCVSVYQAVNPSLVGMGIKDEPVCSIHVMSDCVIHNYRTYELVQLYEAAMRLKDKPYIQVIDRSSFSFGYEEQGFFQKLFNPQEKSIPDSMVYAQMVKGGDNRYYLLLLNSSLTPVIATVATLRRLLMIISAVILPTALILSIVIARRLARPITTINKQAARLALGDFSGHFEGSGYREIGQLADTLNFANTELARTGQLQQDLVANLSHDMRTPLTMIGGYAEYMRDFPEEDHAESIQVIIDEVGRLSHLVQDVLDENRMSGGVEELDLQEFNLTASMNEALNRYNALIAKDGYQVVFNMDREVTVYADERRIIQALSNLLNNAFTHCGADKRIIVNQICDKDRVRVEIVDHGPGIPASDLPLIWVRYYHTDALQRSHPGSGLGLAIVKGIMELHEAPYGVESELGEGTMFWFELKLAAR